MFKLLNLFRRDTSSEQGEEPLSDEELDNKLDGLDAAKEQLNALQRKLDTVAVASRLRQKESKETTAELKKTISSYVPTAPLSERLRKHLEDESDGPTFTNRDKLPSGAG